MRFVQRSHAHTQEKRRIRQKAQRDPKKFQFPILHPSIRVKCFFRFRIFGAGSKPEKITVVVKAGKKSRSEIWNDAWPNFRAHLWLLGAWKRTGLILSGVCGWQSTSFSTKVFRIISDSFFPDSSSELFPSVPPWLLPLVQWPSLRTLEMKPWVSLAGAFKARKSNLFLLLS